MARIEATQITVADEATPTVTLPNIVRRSAQAVRLTAFLKRDTIPANAAKIRMTIDMFKNTGAVGLPGWFNTRVHFTGPHTETVPVSDLGDPPKCKVTVPHPPHPKGEKFNFKANSFFWLGIFGVNLFWRVLIKYLWHGGPGPYDAQMTLTALDNSGTPIADSTGTVIYPFVSADI